GAVRLRVHVEDGAFGVELPAVIEATQPTFLVAPEGERRAAVGTLLLEHAHLSVAVAKDDQVLAEQARAHRGAVALGHFLGHAYRKPVATHELPHGRFAFHPAQQFVLLSCQHGVFLFPLSASYILRALSIWDHTARHDESQ